MSCRANPIAPIHCLLLGALLTETVALAAPACGQVSTEDFKLLASGGTQLDRFGNSISIDNGVVAVGAPQDDDNGASSGSAYLFDASTAAQIAKLYPEDGAAYDEFGSSVAIDDGVVAVGANGDDGNGIDSGSAYLFDASTGTQIFRLLPSNGAANDRFGSSIAIDNGVVAVGTGALSAYLFDASTGAQGEKLLLSDGTVDDEFGCSIAIDNGVVAVGAWQDDDNGGESGSAEAFAVNGLILTVDNLIAGEQALFTILGGTPGERAVTVYGLRAGETVVKEVGDYCATFAVNRVDQSKILGGVNRTFDAGGEITFALLVPNGAAGRELFFQSAEHNTCPGERMSNLIEATVQ